jgi:uncharacterized protein involved in type VI secretion and phage assembly
MFILLFYYFPGMSNTSQFSLSADGLSGKPVILSFSLEEGILGDDLLSVSIISREKPGSLAGKNISFSFEHEGRKGFFNGAIVSCATEQAAGAFAATIKAKTVRHLLDKEKKSAVFCKSSVEEITGSVLGKAGVSNAKCSFGSSYETDFKVQYDETDLAFLQRLFEEHGIVEFVRHSSGGSELVVSDGDDFEAAEGSSFVKGVLESTETGNFFHGRGHVPLRPGMAFEEFGETFIVCSASHAGHQGAFDAGGENAGYACQVIACSKNALRSLPRSKAAPKVPGVIVARVEGFKDAPAALDQEGRYIVRLPFDDENRDMASSAPVHLAQSFAGESCGVHFPLRKDTPVLLAFEDGDIDKPIALGALPSGMCAGPAERERAFRNVLKTVSGIELVLDDDDKSLSLDVPSDISAKASEKISAEAGDELALEAGKKMLAKAGDGLSLEAGKNVSAKAGRELSLEAGDISIKASSSITVKAGGKLVLKGSRVEIN